MLISNILRDPTRRHNQQLSVSGTVKTVFARPYPHFYLDDGTGLIHVFAKGGNQPAVGARVLVRGRLHAGPDFREHSGVVVIIDEQTRQHLTPAKS